MSRNRPISTGRANKRFIVVNAEALTTLNDLSDVSVAGASTNQVLTFNGSQWIADDTQHREWKEDEFEPTAAQITFILSQGPEDTTSVFFIINGVTYDDQSDYSVSGQTVTWLNTLFLMEVGDKVIIKYV
jgi:hypothetical protein